MMDLQITPTVRDLMNKYASQISDRWMRTAPKRYAQLENPELFFAELGQLVLSRVDELAHSLPNSRPTTADESYLDAVARLSSVQRQAEEIAMSELEWPEVELSADEARAEWEATRPLEESLLDWAWDQEIPAEEELEALSAEWMLPVEFLRSLAMATNPWTFSEEHQQTMSESRELRYQRHLQGQ